MSDFPASEGLLAYLTRATRVELTADLRAFLDYFDKAHGRGLLAVLFYGSCFSGAQHEPTSLCDFFLVAGSYRDFYRSPAHALLNGIVPPNLYHLEIPHPEAGAPPLRSKYNVITLDRLEQETGPGAHDHYFIGRLAQKVGIVWSRDEEVRRRLVACLAAAARQSVELTAPFLSAQARVTPLEFAHRFLEVSYASDTRIERPEKLDAILGADPAFYERLFGQALAEAAGGSEPPVVACEKGRYGPAGPEALQRRLEGRARRFFRRSKWKTIPRWAKHLITFRDPVPYLLTKYERHTGHPVPLSPLQRRWPLIFGWPVLFGIIRRRLRQDRRTLGED